MNKIFFIKTVSKDSLEKLLSYLDFSFVTKNDFVALKTHFGEEGNTEYIKPDLFKPLIKKLFSLKTKPFFTDTNTIYVGKRANAIDHLKLAQQHNFGIEKTGVPTIIADGLKGNDYVEVNIDKKYFKKVKIASYIYYSNALVCLTHFKGHMMFGFGGTIKNLGMGCCSRQGKFLLHNSLKPTLKLDRCTKCGICVNYCPGNALTIKDELQNIYFNEQNCIGCGECIHVCPQKVFSIPWDLSYKEVQEKTVEYAYGVWKEKMTKSLFFSILDNITKDCDCMDNAAPSVLKNIGILAGYDPLSIDCASLKIVNEHYNFLTNKSKNDKLDLFKTFWPEIDYSYQLNYAKEIGLGSDEYELIEIQ
jgi:uncharacterized Fe-S center protein